MKASGQLQHHFWGTYAASLVLKFESAMDAQVALAAFPGWHVHKTHSDVLAFHGSDPQLAATLATLEGFGANLRDVSSLATSIDFGKPFEITVTGVERAGLEARGQQQLFATGGAQ